MYRPAAVLLMASVEFKRASQQYSNVGFFLPLFVVGGGCSVCGGVYTVVFCWGALALHVLSRGAIFNAGWLGISYLLYS